MLHVNKTQVWVSIEDKTHLYAEDITDEIEGMRDDNDSSEMNMDGWLIYYFPDGVSAVIKDLSKHVTNYRDVNSWESFLYDQYGRIMLVNDFIWMTEDCTIRCDHKIVEVLE